MYPVSQQFLDAIDGGSIQHIRCVIRQIDGTETELEDGQLIAVPTLTRQCVEQAEVFSFGQMYSGTAEVTVNMPGVSVNRFRGGELSLDFGIDIEGSDEPEWIPLGVWDITEPTRETGDVIRIKAIDRLARLQCPRIYTGTGLISLDIVLAQVEKAAGVEFAQTAAEIASLIGKPIQQIWRIQLADTCWDEVRQIAEIMGGFAYADRQGKIAFRKFPQDPCLTVPADKRFSARLAEYNFGLRGVRYTNRDGYSLFTPGYGMEVASEVSFAENGYIHSVDETNYAEEFSMWTSPIVRSFSGVSWCPGTVEYYGDPALDIGDMILVTDGVAGTSAKFLICADTWQFRGPHTLIAPGPAEGGAASFESSSGGTAAVSSTSITVTKVIGTVELEKFPGELSAERTAARGGYSCKTRSCCFVNCGLVFHADEDCVFGAKVWHDGVAQEFWPLTSVRAGDFGTLHFTVPVTADPGTHSIEVTAWGIGNITDISAHVWGQELTAQSPQLTPDSDYTYTVSAGKTTVTGYVGSSLYPDIPARLGGGVTTVIDKGTFSDAAVTAAYIPEGVTEIR